MNEEHHAYEEAVSVIQEGKKLQAQVRGITSDAMLVELFLRRRRLASEETKRVYRTEIERFFRLVKTPLKEIGYLHLQYYAQRLSHLKPASQARALTTIRSLFSFAKKVGYLRLNPAELLELPKVQITSHHRYLTFDETERLMAVLRRKQRDYLIGAMLCLTGLRVHELAEVCWGDFYRDLYGNIGLVVHGKGSKQRRVKIRGDLWKLIIDYRLSEGKPTELNANADDPLLINRFGQALSDRYIRKIITDAGKKAGITKEISPHWLRHTSATMALVGGASLKQVQDQLGHSSIVITERYLHSAKQLVDTAADYIKVKV